ncbi:hypothetical protein BWI96_17265 [Siphonobacter sp. SORGH_AS_0500]|uniref:hypothetical protein n=1 Tax=Siphonobacter sp. SORGH_AS_0500 TaxID=1864824 RepID=UPI000CBF8F68|nr:hypothetical protein [Siphonobacter sp. SORGH_AS_0500]PKK35286.1 hypothetical protein BWI96_17265 [Siphonobacter sp. SORGH_AS_0500]
MESTIGSWSASVSEKGNTFELKVTGEIPTNGEKINFHLGKNDPQGINPTDLLLTLEPDRADVQGEYKSPVSYIEDIDVKDTDTTVTILGDSHTLANIKINF